MPKMILDLGLLALIGGAAVTHFGWLSGLAIVATVYMLMPYQVVGRG